jgi:hypothetical protein
MAFEVTAEKIDSLGEKRMFDMTSTSLFKQP